MWIAALAKTPKNITAKLPSTDHWKTWPFSCTRPFDWKNGIYSDLKIKLMKTLIIFLLRDDKPLKSKHLQSTLTFTCMKDADLSYLKINCD